MHSRYQQRLSNTVIAGRETIIELRVRRFFCVNAGCSKKASADQVPGLTTRHGRRSTGLCDALWAIALALGGRAGGRVPVQDVAPDLTWGFGESLTRPGGTR